MTGALVGSLLSKGSKGGGKPEYVQSLPETGKEGILYMVNSGVTRDGYAIFQMFAWHDNAWIAIGARMLFVQDKPFPVHWCAFSIALGLSEDIR